MKKITDKLGFVKTNFILCKRHNQENDKTSHRLGENICKKKIISDKGLLYKIYKVILKLNNKQKTQCKMGQEMLNKEDI